MEKKKKLALILSVSSILLVVATVMGIGWFINMVLEVTSTDNETYGNEVNLKEEYPEAWAELGETLKILEYGELDFYAGDNGTFVFSDEFKKVFHKIYNGYYANTSDEQIHEILLDKIDRMTTFTLNAGEVYKKLKPIDGATIEAYLEIIDKRIAENKAREEAELVESKTYSASIGYKIGDKATTKGGVEFTYQGGDKWIDKDGIVHIPVKHDDGSFHFEEENKQVADNTQNNSSSSNKNNSNSPSNNSKYVSERDGTKKGDVITTSTGLQLTYIGRDIWQDGNGETYKARDNGNNEIEFYSKSPFGVSAATDEDGYILPGSMTQEEIEKNEFDPSGYDIGTAGWHAYWDGKTYKEYKEQGGFGSLFHEVGNHQGNIIGDIIDYPDDYVIGSYGVIYYHYYGRDQHLYGKY